MVVDAFLDDDQTQAAVLNNRCLHLVQLLGHLTFFVLLSRQEEVFCN